MIRRSSGWTLFSILKNILLLMLILAFIPSLITTVRMIVKDIISPKAEFAYLSISGEITDSSYYVRRIAELEKQPEIKGLLVKIESFGGLPGSSQGIFNQLVKLKKIKPVVAFVENYCASGAYYIASAAHTVVAHPSALVGGIGSVMKLTNVKDLLESWKIKSIIVQKGEYKTAGEPTKEMTKEELHYLQGLADDIYVQFIHDVALHRSLSRDQHTEWANGKVFTGNQALKLKLIDHVGSYSDAIDMLKEKVGISGEIKLVPMKRPTDLLRYVVGEEEVGSEVSSSLAAKLGAFLSQTYSSFAQHITSQEEALALK